MSVTDKLVNYIIEMSRADIPDEIYIKAENCLIDYLGVVIAGAKENRKAFEKEINCNSTGKCSLLGYEAGSDARTAAFINGFNAHTVELDDGHRFGMIHLGGSIVSAVLSVTQNEDLSYRQLLKGIIVGYEVACRVAITMQPSHKKTGFHTSGTCGTIGAAVGAAVALGYNEQQIKSTISAATTSAAGLLEIQENASMLKPYNVGHAALSGVNAVYMGMSGYLGPDDILGGERGILKLMSAENDYNKIYEKKDYFEIERIYVKPYAACRHCHSAIEATIELSEKHTIEENNIQKINVYTYGLAVKGHDHTEIEGISSAKLSMPYSVAVAYILKRADLYAYTKENVENTTILKLAKKVEVIENREFSEMASLKRISEVEIITNKGEMYRKRVDYAKGDPENPLSREEIEDKFMKMVYWANKSMEGRDILEKINKAK